VNILVNEQIRLTEFRPLDGPALIEHLNDRDIYDCTLRIPFPYTAASAEEWLALAAKMTEQQGRPVCWAIRDGGDNLIGGVGFDGLHAGKSHRGEMGYWLAKPYWGRGIMTTVVHRACQHAFEELGLVKITAHVFSTNPASSRVLEKCGFEQEGFLKKHYLKDGKYLDSRLYALLR
jgi:[ribosomal protein S5]-alanine N-acetyltransferase